MKAWLVVCAFLLPACGASVNATDTDEGQDVGKLTVTWTLEERNDPTVCTSSELESIAIDVTTDEGKAAASFMTPCRSLVAKTVLPPGHYRVTAHAVDASGEPRSMPIQSKPFAITEAVTVKTALDFPDSALFSSPPLE